MKKIFSKKEKAKLKDVPKIQSRVFAHSLKPSGKVFILSKEEGNEKKTK